MENDYSVALECSTPSARVLHSESALKMVRVSFSTQSIDDNGKTLCSCSQYQLLCDPLGLRVSEKEPRTNEILQCLLQFCFFLFYFFLS